MNNFCWTAQCDDEEGGAMKHETIVDNNEAELCNSIKLDKNTLQYDLLPWTLNNNNNNSMQLLLIVLDCDPGYL